MVVEQAAVWWADGRMRRHSAASGAAPAAVRTQNARVAHAARVPDAVEKLEDLDGSLTAQANSIAVLSGFDGAVVLGERGHHSCKLVYALTVVEQVVHDLVERPLRHLLP